MLSLCLCWPQGGAHAAQEIPHPQTQSGVPVGHVVLGVIPGSFQITGTPGNFASHLSLVSVAPKTPSSIREPTGIVATPWAQPLEAPAVFALALPQKLEQIPPTAEEFAIAQPLQVFPEGLQPLDGYVQYVQQTRDALSTGYSESYVSAARPFVGNIAAPLTLIDRIQQVQNGATEGVQYRPRGNVSERIYQLEDFPGVYIKEGSQAPSPLRWLWRTNARNIARIAARLGSETVKIHGTDFIQIHGADRKSHGPFIPYLYLDEDTLIQKSGDTENATVAHMRQVRAELNQLGILWLDPRPGNVGLIPIEGGLRPVLLDFGEMIDFEALGLGWLVRAWAAVRDKFLLDTLYRLWDEHPIGTLWRSPSALMSSPHRMGPAIARSSPVLHGIGKDGAKMPVLDITRKAWRRLPAFNSRWLGFKSTVFMKVLKVLPKRLREELRRWSVILGGFLSKQKFFNAVATHLAKLGKRYAYERLLDGIAAESKQAVAVRHRLVDMVTLMTKSLVAAIHRNPTADTIRFVNIAGGPAYDSINVIYTMLQSPEQARLLRGRKIRISVFDGNAEGTSIGRKSVAAEKAKGMKFEGLDIELEHIPYNWEHPQTMIPWLIRWSLNGEILVGSSEGGLGEYGSDQDFVANLRVLHQYTPADFRLTFSSDKSRDEVHPVVLEMLKITDMGWQLRGLEEIRRLVEAAGWVIEDVVSDKDIHDVVTIRKASPI